MTVPIERDPATHEGLTRGLSSRHLQMIAIGGAIGTGLFLASGATIAEAGPGSALVAYLVVGLMVLLLMQSLGEMASHLPLSGSFQAYASRFVSPSFGFAMGWNYWFNWAITVAAELVAAGLIIRSGCRTSPVGSGRRSSCSSSPRSMPCLPKHSARASPGWRSSRWPRSWSSWSSAP